MRQWGWFVGGLLASVALTAFLWWMGVPGGALFLLLPFIWFPRGRKAAARPQRSCPQCGFASADPEVAFCPRDGTALP